MFRLLSPIKLTVRDSLQQKQNATDTLQTSLIVNYYKIQITKLKKIPSLISYINLQIALFLRGQGAFVPFNILFPKYFRYTLNLLK